MLTKRSGNSLGPFNSSYLLKWLCKEQGSQFVYRGIGSGVTLALKGRSPSPTLPCTRISHKISHSTDIPRLFISDGSSRPDSSPEETWAATAQDESLPRESLSEPSLVTAATAPAAGSCGGSDAAAPATYAVGQPNGHMALLK